MWHAYRKAGIVRPRSSKEVQTAATRVLRIPRVTCWTRHAASLCLCLFDRRYSSCRRRTRTPRSTLVRSTPAGPGPVPSRPESTNGLRFARQALMSLSSTPCRPAANRVRNRPVALPRGRRPAIERRAPVCPLPPGVQHALTTRAAPARAAS